MRGTSRRRDIRRVAAGSGAPRPHSSTASREQAGERTSGRCVDGTSEGTLRQWDIVAIGHCWARTCLACHSPAIERWDAATVRRWDAVTRGHSGDATSRRWDSASRGRCDTQALMQPGTEAFRHQGINALRHAGTGASGRWDTDVRRRLKGVVLRRQSPSCVLSPATPPTVCQTGLTGAPIRSPTAGVPVGVGARALELALGRSISEASRRWSEGTVWVGVTGTLGQCGANAVGH